MTPRTKSYIVLAITLFITIFFSFTLREIQFDNSIDKLLNKSSIERKLFNRFEYEFDSSNILALLIDNGNNNIFTPKFFRIIGDLSNDLKAVEFNLIKHKMSKIYDGHYLNDLVSYTRMKANEIRGTDKEFQNELKKALLDPEQLYDLISEDNDDFSMEDANVIVKALQDKKDSFHDILRDFSTPTDEDKHFRMSFFKNITSIIDLSYPEIQLADNTKSVNLLASWGVDRVSASFFIKLSLLLGLENSQDFKNLSSDLLLKLGLNKSAIEILKTDDLRLNKFFDTLGIEPKIITVNDLVHDYRSLTAIDMEWIKLKVTDWNIFDGAFYNKDMTQTVIQLTPYPVIRSKAIFESYQFVEQILQKYERTYPFIKIGPTGESVLSYWIGEMMKVDLIKLVPLVSLVVVLILFLSFRNLYGVFLPLIPVAISTIWALGTMTLSGAPITLISNVMPTILIAVGSAYGIHFYNGYNNNFSIKKTFKLEGRAILMAALTTIGGFISLVSSKIEGIFDFGLYTSIGVGYALFISLLIIPAMIVLFGYRPSKPKSQVKTKGIFLEKYMKFIIANHKRLAIILLGTACVIIIGMKELISHTSSITMFLDDNPLVVADKKFNQNFSGTNVMTLNFESIVEDKIALSYETLKALDDIGKCVSKKFVHVKKASSVNDMIKKMHQSMNYGRKTYFRIPDKKDSQSDEELAGLIESYIDKFSREDTATFVNPSKTKLRIILQVDKDIPGYYSDINNYFLNELHAKHRDIIDKHGIKLSSSGIMGQYKSVNDAVVTSQIKSIILSLFIVFFIVSLILWSPMLALISIIPIILTILINFGIMGYFNIPLDIAASIIACIAIGVGIDYSIHFLTRYKHLKGRLDTENALIATAKTTGRGILINAVSVAAGFSVLTVSQFIPLIRFGFLICLTMLITGFLSLTALPMLILIFKPQRINLSKS